ncbi:MAG: hypothetical protein IJ133_05980, partial [Clostridia bacterium]|nr:hypothetical protein [Clostridia bacterium]
MSKKSLKEQMEGKGQKKVRTTTRNWPLIITLIVLALLFILLIVIGIVAFHRAEKMSADTLNNLPDMSFSPDASTPDTNPYSMNGAT